jgi:hypothetical protein
VCYIYIYNITMRLDYPAQLFIGISLRLNYKATCFEQNVINLRTFHYIISFRSPSLFYLLTVGVEFIYFHLITLRHRPQSVGLRWTKDRPVAETSTWQHKHSQEKKIHAPGGIRNHSHSKRLAVDLRLRPRCHWDRLRNKLQLLIKLRALRLRCQSFVIEI